MCLIFLSLNKHPHYKLIIAANRDEFYNRQTAPARFWEGHPNVVAGRDLEAGGTWMGMNRNGRISMITNYRDPAHINPKAPSRGKLVSDYLINTEPPADYMKQVAVRGKEYNGFNLVVGTPDELIYYSNYKGTIDKIAEGVHGLSNHLLDTPWPKVKNGLEKFRAVIASENVQPDTLLDAMYDGQLAPDNELPETGIGVERERALSAMFIKSPGYGSRCTTVVLVDKKNFVVFAERSYDLSAFTYTTNSYSFQIG